MPVGRVAGVPVFLTTSWFVLAGLITLIGGAYVRERRPDLSPIVAYLGGVSLVVLLVGSVLLHELGHALTARRYGIGVRGITLQLLGGFTEMDREAPTPKIEAVVSLTGPLVSLLLGFIGGLVAVVLPGSLWRDLALQLTFSNLIVAVFNALPGLPLDGGRAIRAGVWAISHDRYLGDQIAGWGGRVLATICILVGFFLYDRNVITLLGVVFAMLVAITLWSGATQAIAMGRLAHVVPTLRAGRLARPILPVPAGTPLAEALRRLTEQPDAPPRGTIMVVVDSANRLLAVVNPAAVAAVPPERRPWVPVDSVAATLDPRRVIPAELVGMDLIKAVRTDPAGEYAVMSGGQVIGVLRVADVMQILQSRRAAV